MSISTRLQVERTVSEALYETVLAQEDGGELFLTAMPLAGESLPSMLARVSSHLRKRPWQVVGMTVFNGTAAESLREQLLDAAFGAVEWPVTWLESESAGFEGPAGIELHAISGRQLRAIRLDGRAVGYAWEDDVARYCELGDLRDADVAHPPAVQARDVLLDMAAALGQANMEFRHVYRTWFRNRDILAWYGDFNRVRSEFYRRVGVLDGLLPASTGIGARNCAAAALVAGASAMDPKAPGIRAHAVDSPLQGPAADYGSSFSRALELDLGDHRRLTVSGTASIAPAGQTVHAGDATAQVALTMRVVRAILNSRGMDWPDVTRAVAYFRHAADIGLYRHWCRANQVGPMPAILTHHTVCRDDLLYEIEIDAVAET